MSPKPHAINFERAFTKGHRSYDTKVGDWWEWRASDAPHRAAYSHVTRMMRHAYATEKKSPDLFLDYACGSGFFLGQAAKAFPYTHFVALDGSKKMLQRAADRLTASGFDCDLVSPQIGFGKKGPRIRLVETRLPNFDLPKGKCDGVAFVFPNITPAPSEQRYYDQHGYKNKHDQKIAKMLSRFREMDPEDEVGETDPKTLFDGLLTERVVARHIRSLLKKGSPWFKVDYANATRSTLSQLTNWRSFFAEGALAEPIKEVKPEFFFAYQKDEFKPSKVILDVYHQTKDPTDKVGGYFVTLFKAV